VSDVGYENDATRPSETVAGFLSAISIFAQRHRARVASAAARAPGDPDRADRGRDRRPVQAARLRRGDDLRRLFFFFGLTIAVVTSRPLW